MSDKVRVRECKCPRCNFKLLQPTDDGKGLVGRSRVFFIYEKGTIEFQCKICKEKVTVTL